MKPLGPGYTVLGTSREVFISNVHKGFLMREAWNQERAQWPKSTELVRKLGCWGQCAEPDFKREAEAARLVCSQPARESGSKNSWQSGTPKFYGRVKPSRLHRVPRGTGLPQSQSLTTRNHAILSSVKHRNFGLWVWDRISLCGPG